MHHSRITTLGITGAIDNGHMDVCIHMLNSFPCPVSLVATMQGIIMISQAKAIARMKECEWALSWLGKHTLWIEYLPV